MNEPTIETLAQRLERVGRENGHLKQVFAGAFIIGILIVLSASNPAGPSEKTVVPKFKNVDEAIGWVKAKGNCEKFGKEQGFFPHPQGPFCKIRLDLPDEKLPETKGESVWQRWAWMESFDSEIRRTFTINIVRSKNFLLSPNDPKTTVRSVRVSNYYFDKSGKVSEVRVDSHIENFRGEKILRQGIPIPLDAMHKHADGADDGILFHSLGVEWNYY